MKRAMIAIFVILTECLSPPYEFPRYNEVQPPPPPPPHLPPSSS
jgi:hypothetical protein